MFAIELDMETRALESITFQVERRTKSGTRKQHHASIEATDGVVVYVYIPLSIGENADNMPDPSK